MPNISLMEFGEGEYMWLRANGAEYQNVSCDESNPTCVQ